MHIHLYNKCRYCSLVRMMIRGRASDDLTFPYTTQGYESWSHWWEATRPPNVCIFSLF